MLFTVEEDLKFCKELELTPYQLMLIKMLIKDPSLDKPDWKKKSYKMSMEFQHVCGGIPPLELADLITREIIIDCNDIGNIFYDYLEVSKEFYNKFSLKVYPMSAQLYDAYPTQFENNGQTFFSRTSAPEDIAVEYMKAIRKDENEHKKILEDLKWAVDNKLIKLGLKKFVTSKYWETIRKLRNKHVNANSNARII